MSSSDDLMRGVPRGVASRFLKDQALPQARWQDPARMAESPRLAYDPAAPGRKILLGALGNRLIGIDDNRHVLTVAGSRSGKSVTVISNLYFYKGSVIATDPKAELANLTAERRAALGQRVYVLDPFEHADDRLDEYRKSYNPLEMLYPGSRTVIEDAELISDALVVRSDAEKDPHWNETAKNFIEGLILHVISAPEHEGERNLITVRRLITDALAEEETEKEGITQYVLHRKMMENAERLDRDREKRALAYAIGASATEFYDRQDKEMSSVLSGVRRHTKLLDYEAMQRVLVHHDFDLADLKREPGGITVYLCLPASRMGMCNRWLRIFVNQLLDAMEREKTETEAPVLACLDEFPILGHMKQLEDAAGQIASYGVKLWVILQDWGQGEALYEKRFESFAANAGIIQFFSNSDLKTTEYISKRLGKTTVAVRQMGETTPEDRDKGKSGYSEKTELHDLLTPDEVSRMFARSDELKRQLVIWAGRHPMILQRVEYYDENGPVHAALQRELRR